MPRFKDQDWTMPVGEEGKIATWEHVQVAVLMDIRDELKRINDLLHCGNFTRIPRQLARISSNTAKPKKPRK